MPRVNSNLTGGARFKKKYTLEFIRGTGVKINGVTDANYNGGGVNGPWTMSDIPADVYEIMVSGCGAGAAGMSSYDSGAVRPGMGGGGSGLCVEGLAVKVIPGDNPVITIGAKGLGSAVAPSTGFNNGASLNGGATILSGLTQVSPGIGVLGATAGQITLYGGGGGARFTGGSSGGGGHGAAASSSGASTAYMLKGSGDGGGGASNQATPGSGSAGAESSEQLVGTGRLYAASGSGGGGASNVATTLGADGGSWRIAFVGNGRILGLGGNATRAGVGTQNGSASFGGGGDGAPSLFGLPGEGGDGQTDNAGDATGYGSGGGGAGGGGYTGGDGADGYLRIEFESEFFV